MSDHCLCPMPAGDSEAVRARIVAMVQAAVK
jgi:hypothetical protein